MNLDPTEGLTRITVGVGVALIGVVLFLATGSVLAVVLEVLVLADLVITGALGVSPALRQPRSHFKSHRRPDDRATRSPLK